MVQTKWQILKIMICDEDQMVFNSIMKKLRTIENVEVLEVSHMSRKIIKQGSEDISIEYYYTEVSMENVDKWYAIEYLINKLNIDKEEVITTGDNVNDEKMIVNAGMGVAMEQSTPKIRDIAKYVTKNNNEDGVGEAVKKFML